MAFIQVGNRIYNTEAIQQVTIYEPGEVYKDMHIGRRAVAVTMVSGEDVVLTDQPAEALLEELPISRRLTLVEGNQES